MIKKVLDHGYVKTVDVLGNDLSVVNAARASYDKESKVLTLKDEKLIDFLVREHHDSPLRHAVMSFEVYAPLEIKNQWIKHAVASTHLDDQYAWNESSRRYVTETPTFYIPDQFSLAPDNSKQGAGDLMEWEQSNRWQVMLDSFQARGEELYNAAMADGIAPEQARLFLPAYGLYVRWRWTASLHALLNFITLRLGHGAQQEITEYARVVAEEMRQHFPITMDSWMKHRV
jgi:thymidylate synthase (FAD)